MTGSTDWLSATAMLLSGLIVGFMFIYASMRKKQQAAAPGEDLEIRDLKARRDTLIQQLRELEDVPANAAERTRLEREAAQVLRALDGRVSAAPAAPRTATPPAAPSPGMNPTVKGFLWGVGSIGILGFLGWFVYSSSTDKNARQPNAMQPASTQTIAPAQQTDPAVAQLEAQVANAPDDVNARIDLAKAYLEKENMMGVFEQTQAVLAKSPAEPRALTYQALVRMSMGQSDVAGEMLEKATKTDPKLTDAWVGLAWLDFQTGKRDAGEKAIREAMKQHPEQQARLEQVLTEMKNQRPAAQAQMPSNHPALPSPGDANAVAAPQQQASNGDPGNIHITINIDNAAAARAPQHAILYIIARAAGVTSGPPVAVKRLLSNGFPIDVDFGSADSMMGQPMPPKIHLEVRLDTDGDAATKSPQDPVAVQDGVSVGSKVSLVLK
ncbi:MAG TPA: tetratricopeptide repeat protein [Thermoanaerobaculia bacterium]|nr:tetratricopeptide repeat protein [Thermoanaerobaculia bacterium]